MASLAFVFSCNKYDDSCLTERLDDHEARIAALESKLSTANNQITGMQQILTTLQAGDYITSITQLTDGYTINFAKANPITIKNGADGADGSTPVIGIGLFEDVYYWTITLDGETDWMTDDDGNKIPVTGDKGEDAITPVLGIDPDGYWTIKWGDAPADFLRDADGNKVIAKVSNIPFNMEISQEGSELVFNFFEIPQEIRIPIAQPFGISVAEAVDFALLISANQTVVFNVTITNIEESDFLSLRADIQGRLGNVSDVQTRAPLTTGKWDIEVGKPVFNSANRTAHVQVTVAVPYIELADYMTSKPNSNLTFTVLGQDGRTSSAAYLLKVGGVQAVHIYPEHTRDGVYTIDPAKIPESTYKVTLIFDDENVSSSHASLIKVIIPDGFNLPIDIDFDLTVNPVSLTIENPNYTGLVSLTDYYGRHQALELQNLTINLPNGSFTVGSGYTIYGSADIITANSSFTLNKTASIGGDLNVKGGRAMILGEVHGKTSISGNNTEVYFDNSKLRGQWFKTADIAKMGNSDFVGFNALDLLTGVDLSILADLLNAVNNSGLVDVGGLDLGSISNIINGVSTIDVSFLNRFFSTDFYYAGAISRFDNPYFKTHPGALSRIEYALNSGTNKYLATLDKETANTPVIDAIDKYVPMIHRSLEIARKFHPSIPEVDLRYYIPTYYAGTNNFSLQGVVDMFNLLYQVVGILEAIEQFGAVDYVQSLYLPASDPNSIYAKCGVPPTANLAFIPDRNNSKYSNPFTGYATYLYDCGVWANANGCSVTEALTLVGHLVVKALIDAAVGTVSGGMDPAAIQDILSNLTFYTGLVTQFMPYVDMIYDPIVQANDFINSLKSRNPWVYDAGEKTFTKGTVIDNFSAHFDLDCHGQAICITRVK